MLFAKALCTVTFIATAAPAWGMGQPEHSAVAVTSSPAGEQLALTFKIDLKNAMVVNLEGPWKLELKSSDGLAFASTTLDKAAFDEKMPGYKLTTTAKPTKPAGTVNYTLTAFVCTKDKTRCFREVHQGAHQWQTAAK